MADEQELKMPCKMPYPCPYFLLLVFNGLIYAVNALYDHLNSGNWSPIQYASDPELIRQRPYVIIVYVANSFSAIIFIVYMLMPKQQTSNTTEIKMVLRWFFHLVSLALITIVWIFDAIQLWIYKICLNDSINDERIMTNQNWSDPIYTLMYSIVVAYGFLIAIPCNVYLLWLYFVKTEENYKANPQPVKFHKIFNKVCYFATYISFMTVCSLNLTYLQDYETYFVYDVQARYANIAHYIWAMFYPIRYLEYIFTGLALLFAAFCFVKEIFDTMDNKKRHIRRQLLVLTSSLVCIGILMVDRFVEVYRYDKVVKEDTKREDEVFLKLYNDLRKVMWCYIFLLFPLGIYSIRNYWREWKNEFASGDQSQGQGSQYKKMKDEVEGDDRQKDRHQKEKGKDGITVNIGGKGKVEIEREGKD